jgi:hypothetical protein
MEMDWDYSVENLRDFVDILHTVRKENQAFYQAEEGTMEIQSGVPAQTADVCTEFRAELRQLCLESSIRPSMTNEYSVPALAKEISDWACLLPLVVEETCDQLDTTLDNVLITGGGGGGGTVTHFHEKETDTPLVKQAVRPKGKINLLKNMSDELSEAIQRFSEAAVEREIKWIREDSAYRQNNWSKKATLDNVGDLSGMTVFLHCDLDVARAMKHQDPIALAQRLAQEAAALEELKNKPAAPAPKEKDGSDDDDDDDDDDDVEDEDDDDEDKKEVLPPFEFYLDPSSFSSSSSSLPEVQKVEDVAVAIQSAIRRGASVIMVGSTLSTCEYEAIAGSADKTAEAVPVITGQPSMEAVVKTLTDVLKPKLAVLPVNLEDVSIIFCRSVFEVEQHSRSAETAQGTRVLVLEHLEHLEALLAPLPTTSNEDNGGGGSGGSGGGTAGIINATAAEVPLNEGGAINEIAVVGDETPRTEAMLLETMSSLCHGMICNSLAEMVKSNSIVTRFQADLKMMGPLVQKEASLLSWNPGCTRSALAIVGGGSLDKDTVRSKLRTIDNLLENVNELVVGGLLGFTFLKAKGINIGKTAVDEAVLPIVEQLLQKATRRCVKLILPEDCILGDLQLNEQRPKDPNDSDEDDDEDDADDGGDGDAEGDDDDDESSKTKVVDKTVPFFGETQEYTFDKKWSGLRDLKKVLRMSCMKRESEIYVWLALDRYMYFCSLPR